LQARGEEIRCQNPHALQIEQAGKHETDGTLAGDQDRIAAQQGQSFDSFEDGINGLEHGAF
jgi:hypothetical protein